MKKNSLYIYTDSPSGCLGWRKTFPSFPKKFKLNKYISKYVTAENISFSKKKIHDYYRSTPSSDIPKNLIYINNTFELESFLQKVSKKDLIFVRERSVTAGRLQNYDLRLFKKYNVRTIFLEYYPWLLAGYPWVRCNFKKNYSLNLFRFLWRHIRKIIYSFYQINYEPTYLIGSGEEAKNTFKKSNMKKTRYINCPSFWIDISKNKKNFKKNKIIYVDENVYFSRDQYLFDKNYKKTSDVDLFIRDLNMLFDIAEKKMNSEVIIGCSEKYRYKKNIFGGRKIIYGKTLELISSSKLVLGHRSDALFQAVYAETPTILLKHKTFALKRNLFINLRSINHFNKKAYFIEDYLDKKVVVDFNIDKNFVRKLVKNHFLSPGIKKENFSKRIVRELNQLN